jgi:hypothetical protein
MRKGLIPFDVIIKNRSKIYEAHSVVLGALSPVFLENLRKLGTEPKPQLYVDFPDEGDVLERIIAFCYGFDFNVTSANCEIAYLISSKLKIDEIKEPASLVMEKRFDIQNVVGSISFFWDAEADISLQEFFIRGHFSEMMYRHDFLALPYPVLERIIATDEIDANCEDDIALWVAKVIKERGESFVGLVDRLHLHLLSEKGLLELYAQKEINSEYLTKRLKEMRRQSDSGISRHFTKRVGIPNEVVRGGDVYRMSAPSKNSWDAEKKIRPGLVKCIRDAMCPIRITVSSIENHYFHSDNLFALENAHSCWYSKDSPDQWVKWDFYPHFLHLSSYTLRSSGCDRKAGHLKSWRLSASNDDRNWVDLHRMEDCWDLNGPYNTRTFQVTYRVSSDCNHFYHFFRLSQIGVNHHGDYSFLLSGCEFFGDMAPNDVNIEQ